MRTRTLIAVVAALALLPATPASALTKTETATSGQVTASLSYMYQRSHYGFFNYSDAHVKIVRGGETLLDQTLGKECSYCTPEPASGAQKGVSSVTVRDLDLDGEPEVLVDLFSGGANCCWYTNSYRYDPLQNKYIFKLLRPGLSFPYVLQDINHDGAPEFRSEDYRFAYKYGSNADTPRPLRVFEWDGGKLVDSTIAFPRLAAKDAAAMWKLYKSVRKVKGANLRGVLAAYAADEYNAQHGTKGWKRVVAAYHHGLVDKKHADDFGPYGRAYLKSLRAFLNKLGYLRKP